MYKKDESSCLHVRDGFLIHISVRIVTNTRKNKMKKKEELLSIIEEGRIHPVFQPIVSLRDGQILGYEALSRIDGKTKIQDMEEFFQLGVHYGKTWEIEKLCRKKILQTYAQFPETQKTGKLFINVNPLVMQDEKFKQNYTKKQLEKRGIASEKIVIEVTERNTIDNLQEFQDTMKHYQQEGYEIAIDDVGSCYSGLNVIANTKPRYIKIDMALVRGIDKDPMRQALLKGLVEMANHTSFELIAEGIETEDELEMLMKLGIDYGQGYLLERPGRDLMPIRQSIQKKITDSSNNELKRNIWNGKKYVLSQVSVQDYHAIDAYSKKFGENQLSEVFHMLFDIVRKSLSVFDGMYIVDENVCVIIMEKERFPEFSERITKRFDEFLSVLYLENELNQRSMDEVEKDTQELPLLSVQIELIE